MKGGVAIAAPDVAGRLGFYGCAADGRGRVVRVAWTGKGKPPAAAEVACPVCGTEHRVSLAWRAPLALDQGREPEIVLEAG